jgi:hypothetical protein
MAGLNVSLYGSVGITPIISMGGVGYSPLGKGLRGFIPQQLQTSDNTYEDFEQNRFQVVQAWNNLYQAQLIASAEINKRDIGRVITPFRAVNNAGDILSRPNYSCGTGCQSFQSRPNLHGLRTRFGGQTISPGCGTTTVPAGTCNVKYVYDSSDYSRYLKQRAIVKTYNNLSNGGNDSNASQVAWSAIRRF